ncbi:hypothetical protein RWH43_17310 [Microbacterium sp. KSW2-21]|uniref:Uncharacterized protein n=1 Tax=Microbacterium algihabitans TaxID=3075992 RepID=A0ABU3S065_9MICO|nr:hypothetical protein [Microbacterium sp. KSW2-21]MDU0328521.1 hypothetical protein [Microbacterium sp. KSW2-21]
MRTMRSFQTAEVADPVMAKFAMVAPVLEAILYSLKQARVHRLGGYDAITLVDLAREFREGSGDAGICFEWTVHEAIAVRHPSIWPLASEVLEAHCGISGGADSILFGPEKDGRIPILESVTDALTPDSRLYLGQRGQPPKLQRHIPDIIEAFRAKGRGEKLPRSFAGIWKADLFLGNPASDRWVGTTVKTRSNGLEGASGLRLGIYPQENVRDEPRFDDRLHLIRLPLPYDGGFSELYYKSFYLVRAFLRADALQPSRIDLPDAEDRFITEELRVRAEYPVLAVLGAIRNMSQQDLLHTDDVISVQSEISLSSDGLVESDRDSFDDAVSLAPAPHIE